MNSKTQSKQIHKKMHNSKPLKTKDSNVLKADREEWYITYVEACGLIIWS